MIWFINAGVWILCILVWGDIARRDSHPRWMRIVSWGVVGYSSCALIYWIASGISRL